MRPLKSIDYNTVFSQSPDGVRSLPAKFDIQTLGATTLWKLTHEEITAINLYGTLELTIRTGGRPLQPLHLRVPPEGTFYLEEQNLFEVLAIMLFANKRNNPARANYRVLREISHIATQKQFNLYRDLFLDITSDVPSEPNAFSKEVERVKGNISSMGGLDIDNLLLHVFNQLKRRGVDALQISEEQEAVTLQREVELVESPVAEAWYIYQTYLKYQ